MPLKFCLSIIFYFNLTFVVGGVASSGVTKLTSDDDSLPLIHKRKFMITDILNKNGDSGASSRPGSPAVESEANAEIRDSIFSK